MAAIDDMPEKLTHIVVCEVYNLNLTIYTIYCITNNALNCIMLGHVQGILCIISDIFKCIIQNYYNKIVVYQCYQIYEIVNSKF